MSETVATVLHLEDSTLDAELVRDRLERSGLVLAIDLVSKKKDFIAKLESRRYDLILSDYQVPTFEGLAALELAREYQPDTPFIFVSGAMGEEFAVETLKAGATDYILKQRLARLPAAVERALAEARERIERRKAEKRASIILESMAEVFFVLDAEWRFAYVNAAFERTAKVQRADILGTSYWEAYPATLGSQLEAVYRRVMSERVTIELENYYEVCGRWFSIKVYAADSGRICVQARDVTEAKRAAEELRASEERLKFALKAGRMGTWELELATDGLTGSEMCKAIYGRGPEAPFTYEDLTAAIFDEDRPRWRQTIDEAAARRTDFEIEYRIRWPDGTLRWIHTRGSCSIDFRGKVVTVSGISFDITERKRVEQDLARLYEVLREQDKRKDEFLATLAHELRNPLAPVRNGLQILKIAGTGEQGQKTLAMMERQLSHMVRLIDDLMDVSRITRGRVELRKEQVGLRTVIDSALEESRPLIEAATHTLTVQVATGLFLNADPTRIAQVIANLLNNAAKYTPAGGHISLTAKREHQAVVIRVKDTGVGIPADMLPRVFDMFTQVGRSLERSQGGLGIGLTLVRRLVEMHGGTVEVESPGPDQGTTFTICLPLAGDEPPQAIPARGSQLPATGTLRVLVVDDNTDGAESLAQLLRLGGHETAIAHTGPEALVAARAFRPDVVFLDIGLPGMVGYEVAERLRSEHGSQSPVLVALTGWGSEGDRRRSKEVGFDYHLTKPADAERIRNLLASLLSVR